MNNSGKDETVTLKRAYQEGQKILEHAGIDESDLDAWELLEYVSGVDRTRYYMDPEQILKSEKYRQFLSLTEQRARRIPLQHLTGVQWFMGLKFSVDENVLIPRQDTEVLVEEALKYLNGISEKAGNIRILDLCTGSGCILLSVLALGGQNLTGVGSDLSQKALDIAMKNAQKLNITENRAEFLQSDLFGKITGTFQLILSNPPYIPTKEIPGLEAEVRLHDPLGALDGGEDGLEFYRRIVSEAGGYLEPGGALMLEIGYDQGGAVAFLLEEAGYKEVTVKQDLAGLDRVVTARKA